MGGVKADYGTDELHFPEIYGGRGAYSGVTADERLELFELMASIFDRFKIPILIQTLSPEFLAEVAPHLPTKMSSLSWFELGKHEHVSLLFLLIRLRLFLREQNAKGMVPMPVVIDEGMVKAGASIPVPIWKDTFAEGKVTAFASHKMPFLQLADFAAFVTSRTQWLLAKGVTKHFDRRFLSIVSGERLWHVNLPSALIVPDANSNRAYDELLQEDRLFKDMSPGAPRLPSKK